MKAADHFELSPAFKRFLLLFAIGNALLGLKRVIFSVTSFWVYKKDILSGYLLAKAMVSGVNPYLSLNELAALWLPEHNLTDLVHPTPHPFAIGWLCLPLASLRYEHAAVVWLIFELSCLAAAVALFFRALRLKFDWRYWLLTTLLALGWVPVLDDLWLGQFSLCLLVLFLCAWLSLREGRDVLGGCLLGVLMTLKLMGWPVVLWLAWRRRWSAGMVATATFVNLHLVAIYFHGWALVRDYYLKIGPQIGALYRPHDANFSAWTLGQRLFADSGFNFVLTPLVNAPPLAAALNVLAPLSILALALWLARRARSFDTAFALLVAAGVVLNPIAWTHYLLMTTLAWALMFRRLRALRWPRDWTYRALLLLVPFSLTQATYIKLAMLFASGTNAAGKLVVPAIPALLTLVPLAALCGLLWMLARLEREEVEQVQTERAAAWRQPETVQEALPAG
jgi:hypothetical protein